ncbi:MAG: BamA/TamA family outer membrane protein [Deltaproteobacteria bacterium]|jgi:hemolysin activation/secretion protein|nr:BamA/TamA family outer membrane protein [Deltaproteobacteria bacterium]
MHITTVNRISYQSIKLKVILVLLTLLLSLFLAPAKPALAQSPPESGVETLERDARQAPPAPLSRPKLSVAAGQDDQPVYDLGATFTLSSVEVKGATAFSSEELAAPYANLLGGAVGFGDIQRMCDEMTRRYREAGYILSQVILPPQEVDPDNAAITLSALEGFVSEIVWQGEEELAKEAAAYFAKSAAYLTSMRPLKLSAVDRAINLLQDAPGLKASSTFDRSEVPGASVLVISVERDLAGGSISVSNSGTESSGPVIISSSFFFAGLPAIGFQTTIGYTQALDYREYYSISLAENYVFSNGLSLTASYAFGESQKPGTEFAKLFDHATKSHTYSLSASYPVIRGRDLNLGLSLTLAGRDSSAEILSAPFTLDKLRTASFGANLDFSDELGGVTQLSLTLTQGLKAMGATHLDPESSSPMAPADYSRANLYAYRQQQLPLGLSLTAAGEIQLAGTILPSYELFSLGGQLFGRGYDSGTLESDNGAAGYLELRRPIRLSSDVSLTPFAFIDGGVVWTKGRTEGVDPRQELASYGFGLSLSARTKAISNLSLSLFLGKPLKAVDDQSGERIVAALSARF